MQHSREMLIWCLHVQWITLHERYNQIEPRPSHNPPLRSLAIDMLEWNSVLIPVLMPEMLPVVFVKW
jgi:hypothetical protein